MMMRRILLITGTLACCLSGSAALAAAEEGTSNAAAASASSGELEEVVVTAEKRVENLQSLAATVTATSGEEMLAQGIKDITDLSRVAPEVTVNVGLLNNIGIRGIKTNSFGPTLDSANAVYVDGNYNARFTSLNGLFFDMSRVEVLDGPQGTLYGRNSAGGAINVISNKPTQTFGGYGSVEFGNYNDLSSYGALNLPVMDSLAFRIAYFRDYRSGYDADSGEDALDLQGGRAELLFAPTKDDSLLLTAQESQVGGKGPGASTITSVLQNPTILTDTTTGQVLAYNASCPTGNACTSQVVPINATNDPRHNAVLVGQANLTYANTHNDAFSLQYDHVFGHFATLTFQASRMSTSSSNESGTTDGLQQNPLLVASDLFLAAGGASGFSSPDIVNDRWDSEELRLTSIDTKPLQWVLGLYRYHEIGSGSNPTWLTSATSATASAGGLVFPAGQTESTDIPNLLNNDNARAVFGQATWTPWFSDALHVTGGARYNDEGKHGIITIFPTNGPIAVGAFGPTGIFNQANTWTATTYKANIAYDLTPGNLVYIDHSTGFQSGGYGYGGSPAYQPTHIWAWEIGSKNRFFDNRLQVNLSAWYYDYSNQTANISDVFLVKFNPFAPAFPFNFITVANAGESIDRGQSLDVQWSATRDDRVGVNLQHLNNVYTSFNLTQRYLNTAAAFGVPFSSLYPGYSSTGNQSGPSFNYNGTRVGGSPDWTVYATYDHTFHWANRMLDALVVYRYVGQMVNGNQEAPNMPPSPSFWMLPGWNTVDLNLTYAPDDGKYSITLFGRNLFNSLYKTGVGYSNNGAALTPASSLYAYETATYGPPLTYGFRAQANF